MKFFPWTIEAIFSEKNVDIRCSYLAIDGNYSTWSKWGECNSQCVQYAPETTPIQHQSILGKIAQDRVRNFEIAQIVKVCVLNILFFYFQLNLSITSDKLSPDELGVSVH